MAKSKSAKKRVITNRRNYIKNKYYKTSIKNRIKTFFTYLKVKRNSADFDRTILINLLNSIYSFLDKASKNNIFHKNTVARKKVQLLTNLKTL
uniref:30S ribosomal protein S20 n=1 Tax=Nitzschia alba TaxID=2858 RepID=A0A5C0F2K4_NITAL|nr:30S ribosomal protein S20 [Nitzschia alba]QEI59586.1 30S ribosomal protein S20 [Nitzschia alba]